MIKKIYKNLYFDDQTSRYFFQKGKDKMEVVMQEAYLMIYILENLLELKQKNKGDGRIY
jgi:hypothetical protein